MSWGFAVFSQRIILLGKKGSRISEGNVLRCGTWYIYTLPKFLTRKIYP